MYSQTNTKKPYLENFFFASSLTLFLRGGGCNSIFVAYIHEKGEEQSLPYCNKTCYCWMGNDCETPCAECKNLARRGFAKPGARASWLGGGSSLSIGTDVTAISYRRIIIYYYRLYKHMKNRIIIVIIIVLIRTMQSYMRIRIYIYINV